ncbi:MAG: ribonuclease HI [Synechococcales bacterium]|nr:ribonuclease HI [Synechococcales bacterium]
MSQPSPPRTIQSIYTDGACSGNPGPGGWGVVICFDNGAVHELGGAEPGTTNNRMELRAAIAALTYLTDYPQTGPVTLYTDSQYVQNGITKWVKGWKSKGWQTAAGKPVLNQDLWQELDGLAAQVKTKTRCPLSWQYVKAHAGNVGNERCDAIAQGFAQGRHPSLTTLTRDSPNSQDSQDSQDSGDPGEPDDSYESNRVPGGYETPNRPGGPGPVVAEPSQTDSLSRSSDSPPGDSRPSTPPLHTVIEPLRLADEIATQGYLITSEELARLTGISAAGLAERGDRWVWRNWQVSWERQEGNDQLWQLQRIEVKKR